MLTNIEKSPNITVLFIVWYDKFTQVFVKKQIYSSNNKIVILVLLKSVLNSTLECTYVRFI